MFLYSLMWLNKYLTLLIIVVHIYSLFPLGLSDYFPSHFLFIWSIIQEEETVTITQFCWWGNKRRLKNLRNWSQSQDSSLGSVFLFINIFKKYLVFTHHIRSYLQRFKVINRKILNFNFLYCLRLTSLLPVEVATDMPSYFISISPRNGRSQRVSR